MVFCCFAANAQVIQFAEGDVAAAGALNGKSFTSSGLVLTVTDTKSKVSIDANNCYFGTTEAYTKYSYRLKTGGKSSADNCMKLTVPKDGTLNICVRSASSSATDRNLVLTQDGTELFNQVIQDEGSYTEITFEGNENPTKIYTVVSVPVKKGDVDITYPTGSLNFYSFELDGEIPTSYDINITSDPENSYYSGGQEISIYDLVKALGLADEAALQALLEGNQAWYIKTADGMSNATTGNAGENAFWMNAQCEPQTYGTEGSCWFFGIYWNAANEEEGTPASVDVHGGQMPKYFSKIYTDTELKQVFYLVNGDKQVTFNVTLHVNAAQEAQTLSLSDLNIVKDYEMPLSFVATKQYEGNTATITLEGLYEALAGTTAESFDANIGTSSYAEIVSTDTINDLVTYSLKGELMTLTDIRTETDGWFGRYTNFDENTGIESTLPMNAPKQHGAGGTFYIQNIALANGELSFTTGQYPGTLKKGDTDYSYLYIVSGKNAVRIKVYVDVTNPETVPQDQLELAGETTINIAMNPMTSYSTKAFTIDMAAIAEALGCEVADIDNVYSWTDAGEMSDNHTESSGGFYFTADSKIGSWNSSIESTAPFFISISSLADGAFNIGQYANYYKDITEDVNLNPDLIFIVGAKYYIVHISYRITKDDLVDPSTWSRAYAAAYDVQLIDSEGYGQADESKTTLDLDDIIAAIGTDSPRLYTELWTTAEDGSEKMTYSDAYSCDPNPGFYMSGDGRSAGAWGNSPSYGMSYANGVITYYCIAGNHSAGDEFISRFYLVNEDNGKYAQITLNVAFVDERGAVASEVGSTDVKVYLTAEAENEDTGCYEGNEGVDWAAVCEALGITEDEIVDCTWMITNSYGKLVNVTVDTSFEADNNAFDADGYKVDDPANAVFTLGFNNDNNKFMVTTMDDPQDGVVYETKVGLKSEKGIYVFNVKVGVTISDKKKGDVNEDGKVDISDIVAVINQIAGTATYRYADVNEDTKVDISDIVAIINVIAGQ